MVGRVLPLTEEHTTSLITLICSYLNTSSMRDIEKCILKEGYNNHSFFNCVYPGGQPGVPCHENGKLTGCRHMSFPERTEWSSGRLLTGDFCRSGIKGADGGRISSKISGNAGGRLCAADIMWMTIRQGRSRS